ncbi:hypothetical protein [Brevibacillus laterosporus]|uniref:Uncharacterized protein n=1 Tax=Brevibacillus laterosporus TaxID=1465 RepID=A0AAP8QH39_BRELA|nr:hypothetical protein [Brevibacillus laterosporus]PPB12970.1 hypothetical protein C4A77_00870 [Brevibacillus laterosporus]
MTLQEFINMKQKELINTGLYKEVQFSSAIDVGLSKNSTREEFISINSDLNKNVIEVLSHSTLPEAEANNNGSKVRFVILKKRKRKYEAMNFYALYQ